MASTKSTNPVAEAQARIAQQLYTQTDPARRMLIGRSEDFLSGGLGTTPVYGAYKGAIENQYGRARENIISATPEGGPLVAALAGLEGSRASDLARTEGGLYENELERALAVTTGTTTGALGALGQAGQVQAMQQAARAEEMAGLYGSIGTAAGMFLGGK